MTNHFSGASTDFASLGGNRSSSNLHVSNRNIVTHFISTNQCSSTSNDRRRLLPSVNVLSHLHEQQREHSVSEYISSSRPTLDVR